MDLWTKFVIALKGEISAAPTMADPIYYVSVIILVGLVVGLVFLNKKMNQVAYKYTLLGLWIVILILEIFKQITCSYSIAADGKSIYVNYGWYAFPFQLCSAPYFIMPLLIFLPNGVVKDRFNVFTAIFFLFGGIIGFFVPTYAKNLWLDCHTMIYHTIMILVAILVGMRCRDQLNIINVAEASIIYLGLLSIALFLTWLIPHYRPDALDHNFNLFFASWHTAPKVPLLKDLWNALVPKMGAGGYAIYLTAFTLGMGLVAFIFFIALSLIYNHKIVFVPKKENNVKTSKKTKVNKNTMRKSKK